MVTTRYDQLLARLRRDGFRLTPQRMAVLRVLAEDTGHPTVEQVYDRVRSDYPTTSLATIYKTIDMLKGIGEVLELSVGESHRYDGRDPRPHPHLICESCGAIIDLALDGPLGDPAILSEAAALVAAAREYHDVLPQLEFRGQCAACHAAHAASLAADATL
ncbi:MAG: Fur family transcriptional regulator [Thermomicrobiales bacterium]|jgi:Fur family peroxide stress response transcriptional regulator|nr:transcriptional repressor [Thermomicrobiales bacterium]